MTCPFPLDIIILPLYNAMKPSSLTIVVSALKTFWYFSSPPANCSLSTSWTSEHNGQRGRAKTHLVLITSDGVTEQELIAPATPPEMSVANVLFSPFLSAVSFLKLA